MRLGNIEILRGLAALWVVGFHAEGFIQSRGFNLPFGGIFQIGGAGVDLFFVISGFVITLSVLDGKKGVIDFVIARLIRIVPAYWTITLLTCAVALTAHAFGLRSAAFGPLTFEWLLSSLLFATQPVLQVQPIVYQGWTLEYEMLFYLAVAISMAIFRPKLAALSFASLLVAMAVLGLDWVDWVALEFVLGFLGAVVVRRVEIKPFASVILIAGSICSFIAFQISGFDVDRWISFGVPFAVLVVGVASINQVQSPMVLAFGRDSYAVYLVQVLTIPMIGQLLFTLGMFRFSSLASFTLILLATQLTGSLFEKQFDGKVRAWMQSTWRKTREA